MKNKPVLILVIFSFFLMFSSCVFASDSDGTIDSSNRYAWGENIGWVDFGSIAGNVHVSDSALSGSAYGENIGWIDLSTITNNSEGDLSGYAWGENIGWVDFSNVTIGALGVFSGSAYGENIGRITFGTGENKVVTDWRPASSRGTVPSPAPSSGGGSGGSSVSSRYPSAPAGGFSATSGVIDSQNKATLNFNFGNDVTNIVISENVNFTSPIVFSATSSLEWTVLNSNILYVVFCTPFKRCTSPVSIQIPNSNPVSITPYTFYRDLSLHMSGPDVAELQKYLNTHASQVATSGPGSPGQETNYFGLLTQSAVANFQEAHAEEILTPLGLSRGTGYFGQSTRDFVNK